MSLPETLTMDSFHMLGVKIIQDLQNTFSGYDHLMLFLSHLGDPRNAFLIYFPLAYYMDKILGVKVMWASVLSEWINAILKWILHGHRPYWWIHEHAHLYESQPPTLQQFPLTCETGPGSPSGHAMVTASVLFLLVIGSPKVKSFGNLQQIAGHAAVVLVMLCVCVSRCYIATHFPHQVLLGTLVGFLLAHLCNRLPVSVLTSRAYTAAAALVLFSGPFTYYTLEMLGFDPVWCVSLAVKWCAKSKWVYLDTTLFFALVRDSSSLLGLGLALYYMSTVINLNQPWTYSKNSILFRTLCFGCSIVITRGQEYVYIPHEPQLLFYALAYVKYCMLPAVVIGVIPLILAKLLCFNVFKSNVKNS